MDRSPAPHGETEACGRVARSIDELDGPTGVPLLGNALQFDPQKMHRVFEGWQKQYGPLYRLRLGGRQALVLSDATEIAALLRDRPETWRRYRVFEALAAELGAHGVFSREGDAWRRQRKLVVQAFDPVHLKRYFPSLLRVAERLLARWANAARTGAEIDLQADLMRYTVDVTAGLAFGIDLNTLQAQHGPLQEHLDKVLPMVEWRMNMPLPYWRYLRLPADRRFDRHVAQIHLAIEGFIGEARRRMERDPSQRESPANLLEAMICARDADSGALTDEELVGNVFTILLAGEDTTANSLAWALYLLYRNPKAWQGVVDEADRLLGAAHLPDEIGRLGDFRYLDACLNESMRLRPVAPMLILEPVRDAVVLGVRAPAKTPVFCLMRPACLDERNFPLPEQFRPERWLEGEGSAAASSAVSRTAMPFGAGPRLCPGRYLALCEMKVVLAMLARRFVLGSVGTADGREPAERLAFTMMPVGLRMKLRARGDSAAATSAQGIG